MMDPSQTTTALEQRLRPGADSHLGFLGSDERLAEVLAADDELVRRLGLTHAIIAQRLENIFSRVHYPTTEPTPIDQWNVSGTAYRGFQACPWEKNAQYGSWDLTIENRRTGERLQCPGLIAHLIGEHGFYEGKQSPYRVDPELLARVLDLI